MQIRCFSVYIDTAESGDRPKYVLFGEVCVAHGDGVEKYPTLYAKAIDENTGEWGPDSRVQKIIYKLRIFTWTPGSETLESNKAKWEINRERLKDEKNRIQLNNFHFDIEKQFGDFSDNFHVYLCFNAKVDHHPFDIGILCRAEERKMGEFDGLRMGVHQSHLGTLTGVIPREYFYLKGEACFTKDWIESRYDVFKALFPLEEHIVCLIYALTTFVNYWVVYTADEFKIDDKIYNFELFSNRTIMTQSGDCEDVAAWLMSALALVKAREWCDNCMEKLVPINLLLKVDSGCVEGHKGEISENGIIKSHHETLEWRKTGGFHVTCMVVTEEYLDSLIAGAEYTKEKKVYVAEGTALVHPCFTNLVPGLSDSVLLHNIKNTVHGELSSYVGVHYAVRNGPAIYHTVVEIMLNLEFDTECKYKSSIFLTGTRDEKGEMSYPVTLEGFIKGQEYNGHKIVLRELLQIGPSDKENYNTIMNFEPPRIVLDDKVCLPARIPKLEHIGNLGFTVPWAEVDKGPDEIIKMGSCLNMIIPLSVD